jgi:hypothetical protein
MGHQDKADGTSANHIQADFARHAGGLLLAV